MNTAVYSADSQDFLEKEHSCLTAQFTRGKRFHQHFLVGDHRSAEQKKERVAYINRKNGFASY